MVSCTARHDFFSYLNVSGTNSPAAKTKVWGGRNQHDIRNNLRRIVPFALIRLGWRLELYPGCAGQARARRVKREGWDHVDEVMPASFKASRICDLSV
jgi:hypothetical protein